jgi:hypothetical protein
MFMKFGLGSGPDTTLAFLADPVDVTIDSSTQKVLVTSSKAFGTSWVFEGAANLDLWICFKESAGTLTKVGVGVLGLSAAMNTRQIFALSATATTLAPGAYKFGLCGTSSDVNWNSNEFSYTTALVTQ